jgi:hypothetical protein
MSGLKLAAELQPVWAFAFARRVSVCSARRCQLSADSALRAGKIERRAHDDSGRGRATLVDPRH